MQDKKLLQIGEVAKIFHVSMGTLRHYEQAGLLDPEYVDEKTGKGSSSSYELKIVELNKGQFLIAKAGTEIILRGGKATAVVSELGGLQDITEGVDLGQGADIPSYHLLLVPRNDGRGVYCTTDAIFMVRGDYEIR